MDIDLLSILSIDRQFGRIDKEDFKTFIPARHNRQ